MSKIVVLHISLEDESVCTKEKIVCKLRSLLKTESRSAILIENVTLDDMMIENMSPGNILCVSLTANGLDLTPHNGEGHNEAVGGGIEIIKSGTIVTSVPSDAPADHFVVNKHISNDIKSDEITDDQIEKLLDDPVESFLNSELKVHVKPIRKSELFPDGPYFLRFRLTIQYQESQ
jgi:hypothetical protein